MENTDYESGNMTEEQSISYEQALMESVPLTGLVLAISVIGYYYIPTWWWIVVFVFGAVSVFTNRLFYQKTMNLRERLQNR